QRGTHAARSVALGAVAGEDGGSKLRRAQRSDWLAGGGAITLSQRPARAGQELRCYRVGVLARQFQVSLDRLDRLRETPQSQVRLAEYQHGGPLDALHAT